jgi:hypothetical protein
VYILNTSGAVNNDFLGEVRVLTAMPAADSAAVVGSFGHWLPDTGSALFSRINEDTLTGPDWDVSYIYSATPGQISLFSFATVAYTGNAKAVQINMESRKDDAGARSIAPEYQALSTTDYTGSTVVLSSNYLDYRQIWELNPDTGTAWTQAAINGGLFGPNCIA